MKLIFIRHGDPDYAKDSLTEKGWKEANLLAKRIANWEVKQFYCSPLGRAQDTASLSLRALHRDAITYDWLQEFIYLVKDPITNKYRIPWDFMPDYWTRIPEMYHKDEWMHTPIMKTGDVENEYKKVCNGLDSVLAHHGYERNGNFYNAIHKNENTIVFFCHLGVTLVCISHLLGIAPTVLWQGFFLAPTSVTMLCTEEREEGNAYFRCKVLGDTTHLHDGNEPISNSGFFNECYPD